ncbi:hypothetical protein BpHYR1_039050 [Brachionus plicatilis]|uniref:Uncharacterized protein n=1 Tax=Brachionus plicatilis TaxID=10195 RepID=A0A3M7QUK2_BRAPC|nr:hypothetical protein BpHYR1_039050 [Brachionus plicatilis]
MVKNRRGAGRLSTMRHLSSPPRSRPPFSQIHSSMAQRVTFLIVGLGSARTSNGTFQILIRSGCNISRKSGLLDRFGRTVSSCLPPLNSFLATSTCLRK